MRLLTAVPSWYTQIEKNQKFCNGESFNVEDLGRKATEVSVSFITNYYDTTTRFYIRRTGFIRGNEIWFHSLYITGAIRKLLIVIASSVKDRYRMQSWSALECTLSPHHVNSILHIFLIGSTHWIPTMMFTSKIQGILPSGSAIKTIKKVTQ